jgi:hypothetical protein
MRPLSLLFSLHLSNHPKGVKGIFGFKIVYNWIRKNS